MHRIVVKPGGLVVSLYTDKLPFSKIGRLSVERASNVEFDTALQGWTVTLADGTVLPGSWPDREAALAAEKRAVTAQL